MHKQSQLNSSERRKEDGEKKEWRRRRRDGGGVVVNCDFEIEIGLQSRHWVSLPPCLAHFSAGKCLICPLHAIFNTGGFFPPRPCVLVFFILCFFFTVFFPFFRIRGDVRHPSGSLFPPGLFISVSISTLSFLLSWQGGKLVPEPG